MPDVLRHEPGDATRRRTRRQNVTGCPVVLTPLEYDDSPGPKFLESALEPVVVGDQRPVRGLTRPGRGLLTHPLGNRFAARNPRAPVPPLPFGIGAKHLRLE